MALRVSAFRQATLVGGGAEPVQVVVEEEVAALRRVQQSLEELDLRRRAAARRAAARRAAAAADEPPVRSGPHLHVVVPSRGVRRLRGDQRVDSEGQREGADRLPVRPSAVVASRAAVARWSPRTLCRTRRS